MKNNLSALSEKQNNLPEYLSIKKILSSLEKHDFAMKGNKPSYYLSVENLIKTSKKAIAGFHERTSQQNLNCRLN